MKKTLIFDLDGTILDTLDDLADALNYALRVHGYPSRTVEEVRRMVGNGIGNLVSRGIQEGREQRSDQEIQAALETFKGYYGDHCRDKTKPYDGVLEALDQLKKAGYALALVSNKADFAVQELRGVFFPGVFDYAAGEKSGVARKPAPDMVHNAQAALGVAPEECVYIGDSEVDVATARNAGVDLVAVTWGFRDRETLLAAGAVTLVDSPKELRAMLSGGEGE